MSLYDLPPIKIPKLNLSRKKEEFINFFKKPVVGILISAVIISSVCGFLAGGVFSLYFYQKVTKEFQKLGINIPSQVINEEGADNQKEYVSGFSQEQAIISTVENVSPSVVSIIISKELPIFEEYWYSPFEEFFGPGFQIPEYRQKGTQKQEVGGGTGFVVSEDGLVLTNKHVVSDKEADYTVLTNSGEKFEAQVLALDPVQDLAIIKIKSPDCEAIVDPRQCRDDKKFKAVTLGDSSSLKIGQTVIAIGNALGEFRNTVSVGVISGLGRTITASGEGVAETLEDITQTDAATNLGNSGGPLLNLKGEVIGVNTATAQTAQSIGFAIPINKAKKDIEQTKNNGKIVYPFLGIRYVLINEEVKKEKKLTVDYGAWVLKGDNPNEPAVTPGSAAEKAGLQENDIILEFNAEKITQDNSLSKIIQKYNPGDKAVLKILRGSEEKTIEVTLGERSE